MLLKYFSSAGKNFKGKHGDKGVKISTETAQIFVGGCKISLSRLGYAGGDSAGIGTMVGIACCIGLGLDSWGVEGMVSLVDCGKITSLSGA